MMNSEKLYKDYNCDICDSSEAVELPHCREYTGDQPIHVCCRCGFVYVIKRRSHIAIAENWSYGLYGQGYTPTTPLMKSRHWYVAEHINQKIGLSGKKLCDIGAGEGQFLTIAMEHYGADVFGVEPSRANCELLNKSGINNFTGTIEEFSNNNGFEKGVFDIITMMWTLENTLSCRNMLKICRSLVKPGGFVVVATGSRILVPFVKPLHRYLSHNPADTHPFRFSANTLSCLLRSIGFTSELNDYLNDGILCALACADVEPAPYLSGGDNCKEVCDFFARWHKESLYYRDSS